MNYEVFCSFNITRYEIVMSFARFASIRLIKMRLNQGAQLRLNELWLKEGEHRNEVLLKESELMKLRVFQHFHYKLLLARFARSPSIICCTNKAFALRYL